MPRAATRDRNSSTESGAGARSSASAIRPASRIVNVERSAAGTRPSTPSTWSRDADQHQVGRADRLLGDLGGTMVGAVGAQRFGDHARASAHRAAHGRARDPHSSPAPARRSPAGGTTPPTVRRRAAPSAERLRLPGADDEHGECVGTHAPHLHGSPTTRAVVADRVSDRSLEVVACGFSECPTVPSSTSGGVANAP